MAGFRATPGAPRRNLKGSDPGVGGKSSTAADRAVGASQRATDGKPKNIENSSCCESVPHGAYLILVSCVFVLLFLHSRYNYLNF